MNMQHSKKETICLESKSEKEMFSKSGTWRIQIRKWKSLAYRSTKKCEEFSNNYLFWFIGTIKHLGGSDMVWGCMVAACFNYFSIYWICYMLCKKMDKLSNLKDNVDVSVLRIRYKSWKKLLSLRLPPELTE